MKFLAFMTLSILSLNAFSQICYVNMIDRYNRVVKTYSAYGDPNTCMEAMKDCRKAIRLEPYRGGVDCVRVGSYPNPNPNPYPNPNPNPNPNPYPNPNPNPSEYPTYLIMGETVFNVSNSRYAVVVAQEYSGSFVIRYLDNNLTGSGWNRNDLAPLRGCDRDICANDPIYNVSNNRYATVVGLEMGSRFVLKYSDNGLTGAHWTRDDIAVMSGCQAGLCVGTRVYNVSNRRYAVIAALQTGNRFVLKYDDNGLTGAGWNLSDLAPIR